MPREKKQEVLFTIYNHQKSPENVIFSGLSKFLRREGAVIELFVGDLKMLEELYLEISKTKH